MVRRFHTDFQRVCCFKCTRGQNDETEFCLWKFLKDKLSCFSCISSSLLRGHGGRQDADQGSNCPQSQDPSHYCHPSGQTGHRSLSTFLWGLFWRALPWWLNNKESTCNVGDLGLIPWSGRSPGKGNGNSLQYSCLRKSHGQRGLVGYSPWGCKSWSQLCNEITSTTRLRLCLLVQRVQAQFLVRELRTHMTCGQKTKTQNRNLIETFKNGPHKRSFLKTVSLDTLFKYDHSF